MADAGAADTATGNTQVSAGSVGGGRGTLVVANEHASSVVDSSSAGAVTGNSVALAPTVGAGTPVASGVQNASSGTASATGLVAQNTIDHTAVGLVQVNGDNNAGVVLSSRSGMSVTDTSASAAQSGAAWAVAPCAAGAPSGIATPAVAGAVSATSDAAVAQGLNGTNTVASNVSATVTLPGGAQGAAPVNVRTDQSISIESGGIAEAASGTAAGAAGASGSSAAAASGAARAQGLAAQNSVTTNANVNVHVGGENFAPIQVVINSVTHILNWGAAAATTGDATASTAAPATTSTSGGGAATSGAASAVGAQIENRVDLRASTSVRVAGDNYNPISIVMNLGANMVNLGMGLARSGDAAGGAAAQGQRAAAPRRPADCRSPTW